MSSKKNFTFIHLDQNECMVIFNVVKKNQYDHWKNEYSIDDIPISDRKGVHIYSLGEAQQIFNVIFDEKYFLSINLGELALKLYLILCKTFEQYPRYEYMKWSLKAYEYDESGNNIDIDNNVSVRIKQVLDGMFDANEELKHGFIEF